MGEIKEERKVASDLLLELRVDCIDARIGVVTAEYTHAAEAWERIGKRASRRKIVNG